MFTTIIIAVEKNNQFACPEFFPVDTQKIQDMEAMLEAEGFKILDYATKPVMMNNQIIIK